MSSPPRRVQLRRNWGRGGLALLLLLLTGCGNDRPYSGPPHQARARPAADPLASTSDNSAPSGPADPLVGNAGQAPPDPLLGHDPLTGQDPLGGRTMPTDHSHWLLCRLLHDARVTVLLNGVRYKSYAGVVQGDDITMKLRRGINTVKFIYQPNGTGSAAALEIVEGEHHPDIAPLVTFRSESVAAGGAMSGDTMKPVTQTFQFVAN